jgi:hypothetical protein
MVESTYLTGFELNLHTNALRHQNFGKHLNYRGSVYCVSLASIMRSDLLRKICKTYNSERRRFDPRTPFDAERSGFDVDMFPIRTGQAKIELFAALDDDNIVPGSALQSRGMYRNLASREEVSQQEVNHNWLYQDLQFLVPNQISKRPDCTVQLRIYRYVPEQLELLNNLAQVAGTQMLALAEALRIDPSITALTDYQSQGGCISVFFLKAFGGSWCNYRSADDLQAVRAHENIFSNRIFAGFKVSYLAQRVSLGEHAVENGFHIYADYTLFGPCLPNAEARPTQDAQHPSESNGGRLIYADMTTLPTQPLYDHLRADLGSNDVRVVLSNSIRIDGQDWSEPALAFNQWLTQQGFTLHATSDYALQDGDDSQPVSNPLRRCALYRRHIPV